MTIINIFINFINAIFNFEIMNIKLSSYLLTISIILIIVGIIKSIAK